MKPDEINKIIEFIKEQTDFKGDIFININRNAIPVEWIRKYTNHRTVEFGDMWVFINCMINDWEKENVRD